MKKQLKKVSVCLVALLALSCSSDDNNSTDNNFEIEEITVLRSITDINSYKIKGESEFKKTSTTQIDYTYNDIAQLKNILTTEVEFSIKDGKVQEDKDVDEDEIQYGENNKIKSIKSTNKISGKLNADITFEYDTNNRIVKSIEGVENSTETFEYNSENLIIKSTTVENNGQTNHVYLYKYENGNLISAELLHDRNDTRHITYFKYDKEKSPFKAMSVNNFSFEYDVSSGLAYAYTTKNNINEFYSDNDPIPQKIDYKYNDKGYPMQSETTVLQTNGDEFKTITKYTYQVIQVIK